MTPAMLALFVIAAIAVNVLIYAGIYVVYMGDKSGFFERPAKRATAPAVSPFELAPPSEVEPDERRRAA